jgi:hypothetical protein
MRHMRWCGLLLLLALPRLGVAQMSTCPTGGKILEPVAAEVLTVSTVVLGLTTATITNNAAASAFVTMEGTTPLRYTLVGVPSATVGHLVDPPTGGNAGASTGTWFCGRAALQALRMIRAGASDVTLRVTYYKQR